MKMNTVAEKAKKLSSGTESRVMKNMDILDHIEKIVETSKEAGIDKSIVACKKHLKYVTGKLNVSPVQAILFSHLLEKAVIIRSQPTK